MKKNRFLSLACFTVLLAFLAGCAASAPGASAPTNGGATPAADPVSGGAVSAMGRYIEKPLSDITLPEINGGDNLLRQGRDGKAYAAFKDGAALSVSEDFVNWTELPTGYVMPEGYSVEDFAVAKDGTIYFLSNKYTGDGFVSSLHRVRDGTASAIELPAVGGAVPTLWSVKALPSGNLLVNTRKEGLLQLSPDGALVKQYQVAASYDDYDAFGDELAVLSLDDAALVFVDLIGGAEQRRLPRPSQTQHGGFLRYDAEGALYYADETGIYRVASGGSLPEKIVDGALCALSDPTLHPSQILFDAQGRITIPFPRYPQTQFIAYAFDENVPTQPSIVLNLFSLDDSNALQKAILTFQSEHPDVMIRWTVALSPDTSITADDAIRTLNTEVLAGKGPDLFVLDGLPVASYIDKGILADLSGIVQPLIDAGDVFTPIVDAFEKDGERRAVPTRFTLPTLFGDVQGVSTLEDLAQSAQRVSDKPPFADMSPAALLRDFYPSSLPAWKDDAGRLRADQIEAFLTQIRAVIGDWTVDRARAAMPEDAQGVEGLTLLGYDIVTHATHTLDSGLSISDGMGALYEAKKGGYVALPGQAGGVFTPRSILGVNAAGAQADLCAAFAQTVLGDPQQKMDIFMDCLPVRKAAFDALLARERAKSGIFGMGSMDSRYISTGIAPDEAMTSWIRAMADAAATCSLPDEALLGLLVEETKGFFEGGMTAKQAAEAFANRANAYLTE